MLLLDGFNAMAMQAFLDPFRASNYLRSRNLYSWSFLGHDSASVTASNGLTVSKLSAFPSEKDAFDLLVVNASWGAERFRKPELLKGLRSAAHKGLAICGVDTGGFLLAYAGLLTGRRAAVHYEHIAAFRELFPDTRMDEDLFVIDGEILTCCGGLATADLALEIVRLQQGLELANAAGRYIFHDRLRAGDEKQLPERQEPVGYAAPVKLREAIIIMERNLEHLIGITEIAKAVNLSQRQLGRLFQRHTGVSPVRYYLDVRLDRARGLLTQTELPILEVAIACGFTSNAQFSRAYKTRFGLSPSKDRLEGRIPFQFRSYPSHAGV